MLSKRSARFHAVVALVSVILFVLYFTTGGVSPEPGDHPRWMLGFLNTLPGSILWLALGVLCAPAYIGGILVPLPDWGRYVMACVFQAVVYFALSFGLTEAMADRRARRLKTQDRRDGGPSARSELD